MSGVMPQPENTLTTRKTCPCACSGQCEPEQPTTLADKLSEFLLGDRLPDIVLGWTAVAILSLLVLGGIGVLNQNTCHGSMHKTAVKDLVTLVQSSEMYKLQTGRPPYSFEQLLETGLIRKYTRDPWGNDYQLIVSHDAKSVTFRCAGPDGQQGTLDDVFADDY
jgi:competence protein ComGC